MDVRTVQAVDQLIHAAFMLLATCVRLAGLEQCRENCSAFGEELFPDMEVHSFVGVVQQLDEGVDFVGLHLQIVRVQTSQNYP